MKKQPTSYLAGALTSALLIALPVSALAASGWMTIDVDPVNIQVNGEVFHPTDANGSPVLVFACNGTTYAPLRALAEVYGLEVGYDSAANMATVSQTSAGQPSTSTAAVSVSQPAATQTPVDFASQWKVTKKPDSPYATETTYDAVYSGSMNTKEFQTWWKSMDTAVIEAAAEQMMAETGCGTGVMYFTCGGRMLGQASSLNGFVGSNFSLASVWIK